MYNRHSLDLMLLTVHHLQRANKQTQGEISEADKNLKESTTIDECNKVQEDLKINIEKMKKQILRNKLNKVELRTICTIAYTPGQQSELNIEYLEDATV